MKRETRSNVSVEPLPKQGCERSPSADSEVKSLVSVEPLPKQGCELIGGVILALIGGVSVEPLPKQGCELVAGVCDDGTLQCLSGTPAEAGVRGYGRRR